MRVCISSEEETIGLIIVGELFGAGVGRFLFVGFGVFAARGTFTEGSETIGLIIVGGKSRSGRCVLAGLASLDCIETALVGRLLFE